MTEPGPTPPPLASKAPLWMGKPFRILVIVFVIAISVAIFTFRDSFAEMAAIGYPGVFMVSLLGNATIVLPAPSLALVFAMGAALSWPLVGLVAGVGEALGELTGYLAGFGGSAVVEDETIYGHLVKWMERRGGITVFVLSMIPNPFFDLAGIAAGMLRYPVWRFLIFCWLGKTIKTMAVAWAGSQALGLIEPLLH